VFSVSFFKSNPSVVDGTADFPSHGRGTRLFLRLLSPPCAFRVDVWLGDGKRFFGVVASDCVRKPCADGTLD
jgi:hypothetical protein